MSECAWILGGGSISGAGERCGAPIIPHMVLCKWHQMCDDMNDAHRGPNPPEVIDAIEHVREGEGDGQGPA